MFAQFMYRTLGQEVIDELERLHRTSVKMYREDYLRLIEHFKEKLNGLEVASNSRPLARCETRA